MQQPYVSIIVPVYNEERFLNRCLDSVINQTFPDTEVIVVNDASCDGSQSIIDEFSRRDRRINSIENKVNKGQGAARNTGIMESHGRYVFFLDSDDCLPHDGLETLCNIADQYNDEIIFGKTEARVNVDSIYILHEMRGINIKAHPPLLYNHSVWNKLIKRNFLLDKNIFFDTQCHAEDIIFALKCNLYADRISITTKITYYYHWNRQIENVTKQKVIDARENVLSALNLVIDYGHSPLTMEMYRKTACNAYASMIRATVVFDGEELFEHFEWWQHVLASMPGSIFSEMPASQERFCRMIMDNHFEEALKFWKKMRLTGKLADFALIRPFFNIKNLIKRCIKRNCHDNSR